MTLNIFKNIYDTYAGMLYGFALEVSGTNVDAEKILADTFKKIYALNLNQQTTPVLCVTLIKILIQTAHEHMKPHDLNHNFKLKQFENTPILHKLLCDDVNLNNDCNENNLLLTKKGRVLREEVISLRSHHTMA